MADLLRHSITALANASVTVPRASIEALVVDSNDQTVVIADFTGANALIFPAVLTTLTAQQRSDFVQMIAAWLVRTKAGL